MENNISGYDLKSFYQDLKETNLKRGYFFNPEESSTLELLKSLLVNEKRYGYQSCPCRLASSDRKDDLDIICPCDYRDSDVFEYGCCFCGLYINEKIKNSDGDCHPIPERRLAKERREILKEEKELKLEKGELSFPVWRCNVCGYICARDEAPEICPICGAKHDRFKKFIK